MKFKLKSDYGPAGDQPEAIRQLCRALDEGVGDVTLLGVTGSGKTFTMANVIERLQRPALILSHNKTLAAQLYGEFKSFFPDNAVEYFVSYYDYYQPEAYIPSSDTYIEKDLSINDQIEKLRLSTASALLSGRRDVVVISSVSCLYGIGNPDDFHAQTVEVRRGETRSLTGLLYRLVEGLYNRTEAEFRRGSFRVRGDTVDVFLSGADEAVRIEFFGDEVDSICLIDPVTGARGEELDSISIYPANNFVTTKERSAAAVSMIQDDLVEQMKFFEDSGRPLEAKRLKQMGIPYLSATIHNGSHAGYYPGAEPLTLKVLYDTESGKIFGAQAVGKEGVDKRIDVIATIMRLNGTTTDLRDAELCYAPPYSGAKDPVNLIGMAIENVRQKLVKPFFGTSFDDMLVLDVRPESVYNQEHIDGAVNIPAAQLRSRISELPKNKTVMVHCFKGYTSYVAARILMQNGFENVLSYAGGWTYYKTLTKGKSYGK